MTSVLAFKIVAILAFSAVTWGIFRMLSGKGDYETTLSAYLYVISLLYLLLLVLNLISGFAVRRIHRISASRSRAAYVLAVLLLGGSPGFGGQ